MSDLEEIEWCDLFFPRLLLVIGLVWTPGVFAVAYFAGWLS